MYLIPFQAPFSTGINTLVLNISKNPKGRYLFSILNILDEWMPDDIGLRADKFYNKDN